MATRKKNPGIGDMMPVLLIGGGAFAAYWYATNYGPSGAVMNAAGVKVASSWWDGWFGATAAASTTTGAAPTGTAVGTPVGTASAGAATGAPPSVTISNATGASSTSFKVGDTVKVSVQGPPNTQVTYNGAVNGTPFTGQVLGVTDASGNLQWSGVVPDSLIGNITETWFVGNVQAGTINFTVSAAGVSGIGEMPLPSLRSKTGARIKRGYVN